jgi:hypothetical protein
MTRLATFATLLAVTAALTGCPAGPPTPSFRFLNGSQYGETRDLCVNGEKVESDILFGEVTERYQYPAGTHAIQTTGAFLPCSQGDSGLTPNLEAGTTYTCIFNHGTQNAYRWFEEDSELPPAGQAKLRFISAANVSSLVNLTRQLGNNDSPYTVVETLFENVPSAFGPDPTPTYFYKTVNAGAYALQVRPYNGSTVLASAATVQLESRGIYTVVFYGNAPGSPGYEVKVLQDR